MASGSENVVNLSSDDERNDAAHVIVNLFHVIHSPGRVLLELRERPEWFVAFLVISFGQSIPALLPLLRKGSDFFSLVNPVLWLQLSSLVFIPVLNLISWAILALVIRQLVILTHREDFVLPFKNVFSVIAYSNVILLLATMMSWSLGFGRWLFHAAPTISATPLVGADQLLAALSLPEFIFLLAQKINIFTVWFLGLLTLGVSIMTGFSKAKSAFLVIPIWLLGITFQIAFRSTLLEFLGTQ